MTIVKSKVTEVRFLDMHYAENIERRIDSYGILKAKGFGISYMGITGSPPALTVGWPSLPLRR